MEEEVSTSIRASQYDVEKINIMKSEKKNFFFDTHAVVCLLEDNGFSTQQAEVFVNALVRITHSNMDVIYKDMVTKAQQEAMLQRVMSQIAAVKNDMIFQEKSEFSALLTENEKVKMEVLQLKMQLAEVMSRVRADNLLDMNMEKSRMTEMKAESERRLLEIRTDMMEMNAEHERHLTQTNMKIDTEMAGLKTMLESHKLDTIKYLAGSVFTCLTVVLGFYRIWMCCGSSSSQGGATTVESILELAAGWWMAIGGAAIKWPPFEPRFLFSWPYSQLHQALLFCV
ncbi:hypothetical protein GJAV_G00070980 [Gymnothorax javanicus]|nr:hypothetical protein GJAV_G00070980 [Gymnothorax javanicus]